MADKPHTCTQTAEKHWARLDCQKAYCKKRKAIENKQQRAAI